MVDAAQGVGADVSAAFASTYANPAEVYAQAAYTSGANANYAQAAAGFQHAVTLAASDPGLQAGSAQLPEGLVAMQGMNNAIMQAGVATHAFDDGKVTADEVMAMHNWLQATYGPAAAGGGAGAASGAGGVGNGAGGQGVWATLHGDDANNGAESGYHTIQNDGGQTTFDGQNMFDTVMDGIYHMAFNLTTNDNGQLAFVNEDGNANATVADVAKNLTELLFGGANIANNPAANTLA